MKTRRSADITAGCVLTVLGLVTLWASSTIVTTMEHRLSPRAFPYAVSCLILLCGIGIAIKAWRFRGADTQIHWPDRQGALAVLITLSGIGFYNGLMNMLGLPVTSFLYITFATWHLNRAKWFTAVLSGAICGVASYYLFIRLLGLSFPEGFLFAG